VIDNHLIVAAVLPNRIHSAAYVIVMQNDIPLLLVVVPLTKRIHMFFQHDEAHAHYSRLVTHNQNLSFPDRRIGRDEHVQWPQRFPDLTPLYFCLWGWMKS
jgi:hypothetical protein